MKIIKKELPIFKTKIENSKRINKELLYLINLIPENPYDNKDSTFVSHTDYDLPKKMKREWWDYFLNIISPYVDRITKQLNCKQCDIIDYWFQQYTPGSSHGWHNHSHSQFSNVYYIECPKGNGTIFKDFDIECEEGDLITFPSYLIHRSKENTSKLRKTIISYTCDFRYTVRN